MARYSDASLILVRELGEHLGLEAIIAWHLGDSRHGLNTQFQLPDLVRQSIHSRAARRNSVHVAGFAKCEPRR